MRKGIIALAFALVAGAVASAQPAGAFKPVTHVQVAQAALEDALDDGRVSFFELDPATNAAKLDAAGKPVSLGSYPVRPDVLAAIRAYPDAYRTGAFGPDAFPDPITGQMVIHPRGGTTPGVDTNLHGPGPDPWLQHLWGSAFGPTNSTPQAKAFVAGFMSHAAADVYAHSFINYYTGGDFHFTSVNGTPAPENAVKHVVMEGYLAHRMPDLPGGAWSTTLDPALQSFVYETMIHASPGSYLANKLLTGDSSNMSLPAVFSKLRNQLATDIGNYYAIIANYDRRIAEKIDAANRCAPFDFSCSAIALRAEAGLITLEKSGYIAVNGLVNLYKEAWRDDIDSGLKALPAFSYEFGKALFFTPPKPGQPFSEADIDRAKALANDFVNQHLLSMAGAPDAVGVFIAAYQQIIDTVLNALGIPTIQEFIDNIKNEFYNFLLENAIGMTLEQLKEYLKNPATQWDPVMNSPAFNTEGTGHLISLQQFNQSELKLSDPGNTNPGQRINPATFAPAYNSTVLTKLSLLDRNTVNDLAAKILGHAPTGSEALTAENIMLGFTRSLDGSLQWQAGAENKPAMALAANCATYRRLFMAQTGDTACTGTTAPASATSNARFNPTSPSTVPYGTQVTVTFHYAVAEPGGARIFVRPMSGAALAANYAASGSPLYPAGEGEATAQFTISAGPGGSVVDGVRFQITSADQTTVLASVVVPVRFTFGAAAAAADCLRYDPAALTIVNEGASGWLLTDGTSRMLVLDNQADANAALMLARAYSSHCFIGRNNTRPNRSSYITEYWKGALGPVPALPNADCIAYNAARLTVVDEGASGWLLTDGSSRMLVLDNQADANAALSLARDNRAQCFIGRDNTRPNRSSYIVTYWR